MAGIVQEIDRQAVFRQRRVLLAIALILTAIHLQAFEITAKGALPAFGLVLDLKQADLVIGGLWLAWLWSLLRYWQYQSTYRSIEQVDVIRDDHERKATRIAVAWLQSRLDSGEFQKLLKDRTGRIQIEPGRMKRSTEMKWTFNDLRLVEYTSEGFSNNIGGYSYSLKPNEVEYVLKQVKKMHPFTRPYYFDYFGTYFLAAAPVFALIFRAMWPIDDQLIMHCCAR